MNINEEKKKTNKSRKKIKKNKTKKIEVPKGPEPTRNGDLEVKKKVLYF